MADVPMAAPVHEHIADGAGESVTCVGVVADEAEGLERRGAHGPIVTDGCFLVYPRRKRDFDAGCFGSLPAGGAGSGRRSVFEGHLGCVSVEEGSQDVFLDVAGY